MQDAPTRYAGLAWLVAGFVFYVLYRRQLGPAAARDDARAGAARRRARARVPLDPRPGRRRAGVARGGRARGAARDRARGPHRAAARDRRAARAAARRRPDASSSRRRTSCSTSCAAIAEAYGVRVVERVVRARNAGRAIVDEAERRGSEIIVLGAPRGRHRAIFGHTVDYVLKHAPSRVMVAAGKARRRDVPHRSTQLIAVADGRARASRCSSSRCVARRRRRGPARRALHRRRRRAALAAAAEGER